MHRDQDHAARPRWIEAVELVSVLLFGLFCFALAARVIASLDEIDAPWFVGVAALLGVALADLASGVVHWFADTFLRERSPILGPLLIRPFREHHLDPRAMLRHGFLELSGNNALICLPLLWIVWAARPVDSIGVLGVTTALSLALAVFATNHIHRWAHAERAPRGVRWLQARGLILQPRAHAQHHATHDRAYCVTTGWLNPLFDRVGFFPALERGLRRVTGSARGFSNARPRRACERG